MPPHILLTVDVEDWFQVENFKPWIPYSSWESCELRAERNTHRILDLLDEASCQRSAIGVQLSKQPASGFQNPASTENPAFDSNPQQATCNMQLVSDHGQPTTRNLPTKDSPKATFFVLGWLAERLPHLIHEIQARGHEVASHGYHHELCSSQSLRDLERDLFDSKNLLEDTIGAPVYGYRAPSFSATNDMLKIIQQSGYLYDSSYNSFSPHGRYGKMSFNGKKRNGIAILINEESILKNRKFYELPISNLQFFLFPTLGNLGELTQFRSFSLPWGGGAYFRLLPSIFFRFGMRAILKQQRAYLFYFHPWELDPGQPRVQQASACSKFRHYSNLARTTLKLSSLLRKFSYCQFITCKEYLSDIEETAEP
jgi:peptidoglycan-N-acetylglucosamine deacetylase